MRFRVSIIFVAILFLAMLAQPASAATSQTINYTEDFVDAPSNLRLATPDLGTHSIFADLQDYGANYDQMLEENTGGAGNDFEHFVNQTSDLHDPTPDKGTHSVFVDLQDKDATYDTMTEADQSSGSGGVLTSEKDDVVSDTTTSTTSEDVDGLTLSITTGATSDILLLASIECSGSEDAMGSWMIVFDGINYHSLNRQVDATNPGNLMLAELIVAKAAGTYTYKIQHNVTVGTLTTRNSNIAAIELHNGDGAVPAAVITVSSDTVGNSWNDIVGLTTDITLSATSHIWVIMVTSAYMSANNKDSNWAINIDATRMEEQKRDFGSSNQYGCISLITRTASAKTSGVYTIKGEWKGAGGATLTGENMILIAIAAEANSGADSLDIQKSVVASISTTSTSIENMTGVTVTPNFDDTAYLMVFYTVDSDVSVVDTSAYTTCNVDGTDHTIMERGHGSINQHGSIGHVMRTDGQFSSPVIVQGRWYTDATNTLTGYTIVMTTIVLYAGTPATTDYELDLEVRFTDVDFDETGGEELCVFGGTQASEALRVDVWDGSWVNIIADVATDNWSNVSIVAYLTAATIEFRFIDADQTDDGSGDTWSVDAMLIHAWTVGAANYELDLEIGWSTVDYDETVEKLCIYPVTGGGWPAEDINVEIWTGSWTNLYADLTPDTWNNISIASYLTGAAVEVRFLGGTEAGDTTQDTWEIDAVLIQTYSTAYTEIRYDLIDIDEVESLSVGRAITLYDLVDIDEVEILTAGFSVLLNELIDIFDTYSTALSKALILYDIIGFFGTTLLSASFVIQLFELLGLAATVSADKIVQLLLYDLIGIFDTYSLASSFSIVLYEVLPLFESISLGVGFSIVLSEVLPLYESIFTGNSFSIVLNEVIDFDDTYSTGVGRSIILTELINLDEVVNTSANFSIVLAEEIGFYGTYSTSAGFSIVLNELIDFHDSVGIQKMIQLILYDKIEMFDTYSFSASFSIVLYEVIDIFDTYNTSASFSIVLNDTIDLYDSIDTQVSAGLTELYLFEVINYSETVYNSVTFGIFLNELIDLSDSFSRTLNISLTLTELIGLSTTNINIFTGDWYLSFEELISFWENDVWAPYRPDIDVGPGAVGTDTDIPWNPGSAKVVYDLAPIIAIALGIVGFLYVTRIRPKRMSGPRVLKIKGVSTVARTGRSLKKEVRVKKKRAGIIVRKARKRVEKK